MYLTGEYFGIIKTAYTKIAKKLFELDPNEMVTAFANMMKRKISMPAHLMYDGHDHNLFDHFAIVTSRILGSTRLGTIEKLWNFW